jgi:exodeoxyribonuclease VII small subunit
MLTGDNSMGKKKSAKKAADKVDFEESLGRLEEIVHLLEEGDLGLNDSLARYEEGVALLRQSYDALQNAERRIELLSGLDAQGNPVTQSFDDTATLDSEKRSAAPKRGPDNDVDSGEVLF